MNCTKNTLAVGLFCLISAFIASCDAQSPEEKTTFEPDSLKLTGKFIERNQFLESISGETFSIRLIFHGDAWDEDLKSETSTMVTDLMKSKLRIDSESSREIVLFLELSTFGEFCLYQVQFGVVDALITPAGDRFNTLVYNRSTSGVGLVHLVYEKMLDRITFVAGALFDEMKARDL